jgi:hypothetical protein
MELITGRRWLLPLLDATIGTVNRLQHAMLREVLTANKRNNQPENEIGPWRRAFRRRYVYGTSQKSTCSEKAFGLGLILMGLLPGSGFVFAVRLLILGN